MARASGAFEVQLVPQGEPNSADGSTLGRMSIDKQFHGDLEATSKGEMLSAGTGVKGSAGYVAMERVTGMLHGQSGSFVFAAYRHHGAWRLSTEYLGGAGFRLRPASGIGGQNDD